MTELTHAQPRLSARRARGPRASTCSAQMTLEEKLAQLVGFWDEGRRRGRRAARRASSPGGRARRGRAGTASGHLTRVVRHPAGRPGRAGRVAVGRAAPPGRARPGSASRRSSTRSASPASPPGSAATFPTPLAWGASFDPELVEEMGALDRRRRCATLGIHQGLAPVLDVVRDPRWGRVDECIAEDPYVVGTIGTAYVRGLQSAGVHATLKHFVGYSASQAGRNFAPGARRPARDRRRPARPVRDGGPRRRGTLGHELLHRDRRRARGRRPRPAHRASCATAGASTAPSSPTTSASRSCTCCTRVAGDLGEAAGAGARGRRRHRAAHG